ncbi:hypothetical protein LG634_00995 [Streptomyces bambusae]|uniref:FG-GAP-like repeat-containing protein n=1 Tax=Streptomyces bambusae TaxID=1550616 RepID=UPI001CFE3EA3|nr:FG-GAP-like repeat-containing protein [Streptomyces bambusae]MCB5163430.1 hypothetical protein [Streptomyces bambusae]
MGTPVRIRRRRPPAVAAAAALLAGVLVPPLLAAGPATAAPRPYWLPSAPVTGTERHIGEKDLVIAGDGWAAAVWQVRVTAGGPAAEYELYAAARPPHSSVWQRPRRLSVRTDGRPGIQLAAGTDGLVTAVWREPAAEPGADAARLVAATLSPAGHTWSAPNPVYAPKVPAAVPRVRLAAGPRGVFTAAWTVAPDRADAAVYTATRTANGVWGPPVRTAAGTPEERPGVVDVAVGPTGRTVLAYRLATGAGHPRIDTVARTGPTAPWGAPEPVSAPEAGTDDPAVAAGPDGSFALSWGLREAGDKAPTRALDTVVRRPGAAGWGAAHRQPMPGTIEHRAARRPLIGPDGDVTLLWEEVHPFDWSEYTDRRTDLRSATLEGGAAGWRPAARIAGPGRGLDVSLGPDGTVRVLWTSSTSGVEPDYELKEAVRDPHTGTWSLPALPTRRGEEYPTGQIAAGPGGSAALLWTHSSHYDEHPLMAARTGTDAVRRDFGSRAGRPDGTPDLFQTTPSGGLRTAYGTTARGGFSGSAVSTGWPKGFLPVPVGDLNGDRCNDVLVRLPDGVMRAYTPACGAVLKPATRHTVLGKGWNAYDVITSPGDVTGDDRADLVARDPKSGVLYLYAARGAAFAPRTVIGSGYKGYKKIIGAGDVDGDGYGDLLLQDRRNFVHRMSATGTGGFAPLRQVQRWLAPYDAVVGVGDLTGDGLADLVARDTAGTLWLLHGISWRSSPGDVTQLGTGWQVYDRLA